jgi:hypothetical protein
MVSGSLFKVDERAKTFFHREGREDREEKTKQIRVLTSRPSRSSRFITPFCESINEDSG